MQTTPHTVVVVDDDPAVRSLVEALLKQRGYGVITVPNGNNALAAIESRQEAIYALISDLEMPGMNGIDLMCQIAERWPEIRLILISGTKPQLERVSRLGIVFVSKPFRPQELLAALDSR